MKNIEFREYSQKYLQMNREKDIVFEADEVPFFKPAPELSELGRSTRFEQELKEKYPSLQFGTGCIADGAILMQDVLGRPAVGQYEQRGNVTIPEVSILDGTLDTIRRELEGKGERMTKQAQELNNFSTTTLQVVDGNDLTNTLMWDLRLRIRPRRYRFPVFVFPGKGGETVASYMTIADPMLFEETFFAFFPKRSFSELGREKNERADGIFLVTDVVAPGKNLESVIKGVKEIKDKFPRAQITLATWLFIDTADKNCESPSGIDGIDTTLAAIALRGNYESPLTVLSLSGLLKSSVDDLIKIGFTQKYAANPTRFQKALDRMKKIGWR